MNGNNGSGSNHNPHLGVNKLGKNIRKSPLHHPNFPQQQPQPPNQPQPLVYNISKNEFRSIVQQLTGTPSRNDPSPPPPPLPRQPFTNSNINSSSKPAPSNRLQRIRPPPLAPIARAPPLPPQPPPAVHNPNQNFRLPSPLFTPSPLSNPLWAAASESPISAYARYLENSIVNQPNHPAQSSAPLPPPPPPQQQGILPTPPPPLAQHGLPSPSLPSPSAFLNLLSPRSPHLLFSPNFQFPPPLSPGLLGSPFPQAAGNGILGPGPQQPPPSPGLLFPSSPFPLSPTAFLLSPRWRNM